MIKARLKIEPCMFYLVLLCIMNSDMQVIQLALINRTWALVRLVKARSLRSA